MKIRILLFSLLILFPGAALCEKEDDLINCSFYRSKLRSVPVYEEPTTTARVVAHLSLGELVCYVGEQQEFAIVDWSKQNLIGKQERKGIEQNQLTFVRLVDLWEPRDGRSIKEYGVKGVLDRAKQYYYYLRSGGVPEQGFFPFDSLKDGFSEPEKLDSENGGIYDKK